LTFHSILVIFFLKETAFEGGTNMDEITAKVFARAEALGSVMSQEESERVWKRTWARYLKMRKELGLDEPIRPEKIWFG